MRIGSRDNYLVPRPATNSNYSAPLHAVGGVYVLWTRLWAVNLLQNTNMFKQVILLWMFFDCGFADSVLACDDIYGNNVLFVSRDSSISSFSRNLCESGFNACSVVLGEIQTKLSCSSYQRNRTIRCSNSNPYSLTGVFGIVNCCSIKSNSFDAGGRYYPCSAYLSFPVSRSMVKYGNALGNEVRVNFNFILLFLCFVTFTVI